MKHLYRTVVATLLFSMLAVLAVMGVYAVSVDVSNTSGYLRDLVEEVSRNASRLREEAQESRRLLQEDYVNRAQAVDYMMEQGARDNWSADLQEIRQFMDIEAIHLMNLEGTILEDTDPALVGTTFDWMDGLQAVVQNGEPSAVQLEANDQGIVTQVKVVLPAAQTFGGQARTSVYRVLSIDADVSGLRVPDTQGALRLAVLGMSTERSTVVMTIHADTGDVGAVSVNNDRDLQFTGGGDGALAVARAAIQEPAYASVNGQLRIVRSMRVGSSYVLAFTSMATLLSGAAKQFAWFAILLAAVAAITVLVLRRRMARTVLRDVARVRDDVRAVLAGDFSRGASSAQVPELRELFAVIQRLREGYIRKSEHWTVLFSALGDDIGVFECSPALGTVLATDNIQHMVGYDDETWKQLMHDAQRCEREILAWMQRCGEQQVMACGERYLELRVHREEGELQGIMVDRTAQVRDRQGLQRRLDSARQMGDTDALTEVLNRRGFTAMVENLDKREGMLLIADVDDFKQINDRQGHPAGDRALRTVAQALREQFRSDDVIGRIGGDEFCVWVTRVLDDDVLAGKLGALQARLSRSGMSLSVGVARSSGDLPYEMLYQRADSALYAAKHAGKHQYRVYDESERGA